MMHFFAHFWLWFTSIFLYLALAVIDYVPMTPFIGGLMGAAIVFCLVAFYVFSKGYKHGLVVKLIRWIGKIPGLKGWSTRFQERHAEALQNIDKQIAALHKQDKRSFYYSLFMEYASRIVQSLEILFMLLLFGIDCGGTVVHHVAGQPDWFPAYAVGRSGRRFHALHRPHWNVHQTG